MHVEWFAGRLRELRESAGLTQQQLAERASMAWRTITHLESGDRKPSWETVLALSKALDVSCEAFTSEPMEHEPKGRGRPRKAKAEVAPAPVKRPRRIAKKRASS